MPISAARVQNDITTIAGFTHTPRAGASRPTFSAEWRKARDYVIDEAQRAGCDARVDAVGNVHIRTKDSSASKPVWLSGSHIDSVPHGGDFDGVVGVVAPLEVLRAANEDNRRNLPLELIIFAEEEGTTFGQGMLGSRGWTGTITVEQLGGLRNSEGQNFLEAGAAHGVASGRIAGEKLNPGDYRGFVELHIEQGPAMWKRNQAVALVTAINGRRQYRAELHGVANHAGSTSMSDRRDALAGAAEVIAGLEGMMPELSPRAVATVGQIQCWPNAVNVIPEKVAFTIDFRAPADDLLEYGNTRIRELVERIAVGRELSWKLEMPEVLPAVAMDSRICEALRQAAGRRGIGPLRKLPAGLCTTRPCWPLWCRRPCCLSRAGTESVIIQPSSAASKTSPPPRRFSMRLLSSRHTPCAVRSASRVLCSGTLLIGWCIALSPSRAEESAESLLQKATQVLARIDGEINVPGLREPVEVLRDRWGVPHIYANNADDLFFAQGFVVAQDRLFQIDMWRRVGLGETSEVIGKEGIAGDRFARLMKFRGDLDAEWNSYAPDAKQIATRFTSGINACIDYFGKNLPVEFQLLGYSPARWQPEDILGRMSGLIMSSNFRSEVARAELIRAVGVEKARRISPTDPVREFAPAPGLDLAGIGRSLLKDYELATRSLPFEAAHSGSNNWAVDGTLSASGKPLLAGDPHRSIMLPSLRYLVHLNAPGWNVIGSGEPALPGVAIGHNERVAWAFTIVGTDQADFYIEETNPDDPTQYKVGERWEPMKIVREKMKVRGASEPVEIELRYTRHGPVVQEDPERHRAVALRWVGHEPGAAAYLPSLRLDRVKDAREFVENLAHWKIPALNMVHADVNGRVGWVAAGLTPVRQNSDGLLPVPGDGQHEWQRFLTVVELPQIHNPANHWVATANHNILPPGYQREISYEWSPPYRFGRIKQRLEAKQKFDLTDFQSMQHDNTSLPAQTLVRLLGDIDLKETDPDCVSLMRSWDGVLERDSRQGVLYAFWLKELLRGFFKAHVPAETLEFLQDSRAVTIMLAALEPPSEAWFGENPRQGRDTLLATTLSAALQQAKERYPEYPAQGTWGEMHTATFQHPLAGLGPAYAKAFSLGPVPRGGDGVTPHAASYNKHFQQVSGASYRHVLDLADWDRGLATSTPGQSGQPGSPNYGNLLPLWTEGQYFPLAFSRAKVKEVTQYRLRLKPARER